MTTPLERLGDQGAALSQASDSHASDSQASASHASASHAPPSQERRTRRVTRWLLALLTVLALAWLFQASIDPIDAGLVIDGEEIFSGAHSSIGERFALFAVCAAVVLAVLLGAGLIVPVVLAALVIVALSVAAVVVVSVLGVPLLVIGVIALVLSPFLLLAWLLWKLIA